MSETHYKVKAPRVIFLVFAVIILLAIAALCFMPVWHVLMLSISNPTEVTIHKGLALLPLKNIDWTAYSLILSYDKLWRGYMMTIIYIVLSCLFTGVFSVIAGFVFSRNRFRYRNAFMLIISFTMLFNGGMIPTYLVIQKLGMVDTIWALVIPGSLNVFNIILMRTAMQGISDSLEDAARIDGANDFTIMFKIILPLCKATFAVIMLFTVVYKWNDYMSALLYLPNRTDLNPLQMAIKDILFKSTREITSASDVTGMSLYAQNIKYAVIVVSTFPILCAYPFVQKYFVTGMTVGAVKS